MSGAGGDSEGIDRIVEVDSAMLSMIEWIKHRIRIKGFNKTLWTEDHDGVAVEFLSHPDSRKLLAYMTNEGSLGLVTAGSVSPVTPRQFTYFVRSDGVACTPETIAAKVTFGFVNEAGMESLLRVMKGVYVPQLTTNTTWPDSVRKEVTGQVHRFMASLIETANQAKGKTVLYLPDEPLVDVRAASKDKDLVQRLESTVIHWTRQIKEVVTAQEASTHTADTSGPLDEIEFWRRRTLDLSGISDQLQQDGVKAIVAVLSAAKSSYLGPFDHLAKLIQRGSEEANDNLKFLNTLVDPCTTLASSEPSEIPEMIGGLLNRVRVVGNLSRFYRNDEKLTSLLRKVSNEIIHRCCAKISIPDAFDGDVLSVVDAVNSSIACCVAWRETYDYVAQLTIESASLRNHPWNLDKDAIFAQVEAFMERCRNLMEICEGQTQFARRCIPNNGGEKAELPKFGGSRGPEIAQSLTGIEVAFEGHLDKLRPFKDEILDVKATRWHDAYNTFRGGIRDLEMMMQNVITVAFEGVKSFSTSVELLEAFHSLAKRPVIMRAVEKRAAQVWINFKGSLDHTKAFFEANRTQPNLGPEEPRYAGAALWAKSLQEVAEQDHAIMATLHYLPPSKEQAIALDTYRDLSAVFEDYIRKKYSDWMAELSGMDQNSMQSLLGKPLLVRAVPTKVPQASAVTGSSLTGAPVVVKDNKGFLESNFDKALVRLFAEVNGWDKFQGKFLVPFYAADIVSNQKERLRVVREYVMLVVRDYNQILDVLASDERRLFSEVIRRLDRKIMPGLTKLTWASKGVVEYYVKDCRKLCAEVFRQVTQFKADRAFIMEQGAVIGNTLLVDIEKNYVHDEGVFESKQAKHRARVSAALDKSFTSVRDTCQQMYANFAEDPGDVQKEWSTFVRKFDQLLEENLRYAVKKSLQELSRAINGDSKNEPPPLFKVNLVLENGRVEFKPSMINLTQMVNLVSKEIISIISIVPRLETVLPSLIEGYRAGKGVISDLAAAAAIASESKVDFDIKPSFYEIVSNDEDILKILVLIMNGMSGCASQLQKQLLFWDKYKHLWEGEKLNFIRRYARTSRPLSQFEADISRYRDQMADIRSNDDEAPPVNFIRIDCSLLKAALVDHCTQWQKHLTDLLNENALKELEELNNFMVDASRRLKEVPTELESLSRLNVLLKDLRANAGQIEQRFGPLEDMYGVLAKFDVVVSEAELQIKNNLRPQWTEFQITVAEAEATLKRCKVSMKKSVQEDLSSFSAQVAELRSAAMSTLPFNADKSPAEALKQINEFKQRIAAARAHELSLRPGLDIFEIPQPDNSELAETEKEVDALATVWEIAFNWENQWNSWKTGEFASLNVEAMETAAAQYNKQIGKLRDLKKWGVWTMMREKIDRFRATLPLIQDLRNPAMRDRHWDQLRAEVNKPIDPHSSSFTLEMVDSLGLSNHADFISDLSATANKELGIETALKTIENVWRDMVIELADYKEVYIRIRTTEDLFSTLEDHQVNLSTMKASRFSVPFAGRISTWESTLANISEVVETQLAVQRQWMYLESIFLSSEDIRKQLPAETALFDQVNRGYMDITDRMRRDPNAVRACSTPGLLASLNTMDEKLQIIQKSLESFLETKRQRFPRFYFLSNDDLLEILGQQRDPIQVQKHIKKCFEGIKNLEMIPIGKNNNKTVEAVGMNAPDGEQVMFVSKVIVDGPVEDWLIKVEDAMILALKKLVMLSITAYRGAKDKWIKDFPGQLLITTGMIAWVTACTKALQSIAGGDKKAMKVQRKKQVLYLGKLAEIVRMPLDEITRSKLVALITIELHNRDVIERIIKANCNSITDFEWLSQLRLSYRKDDTEFGVVDVQQTNCTLTYGYEYQGNNGRLVVTPLTDRCVLTLTTALHLQRGGSPMGPAGTGKTETVKDLGKNLAKFVVVFNCSDGLDYKSVGRMFSGLVQSGGWGCFDEFNRIDIEVLSVIAQQITSIMSAIKARKTVFTFMDTPVKCNWNCGIFITMNPGYAGRTELPDNLKSLFRPVAMMVPDLMLIAEVMLQAEGFVNSRLLAKKTVTLYGLMVQQLSKQDHYDYGLRSLRGVLVAAGALKRADPDQNEEYIMLQAIRDMNMPKFIKSDAALFKLLLGDLFPALDLPAVELGSLGPYLETELTKSGLQKHANILLKCIELRDSKATRHCNMLVGRSLSGKSTCWKTLAKARTAMAKDRVPGGIAVAHKVINPKSISMNELYGAYDLQTMEWTDGILSSVFRGFARDEKEEEKWLVLDGPVDTLWIESMNTVMDDNKTLTLINGDRIAMSKYMSLVFEVQDLAVASPATVSRAGMVYLDVDDLGYRPFVESWLAKQYESPDDRELVRSLFDKWVPKLLEFRRREIKELVPITEFNAVISLCRMFQNLAVPANGCSRVTDPEGYNSAMERWFVFCCVWSIGAAADEQGRRRFSDAVRDVESILPPGGTVYDYYIDMSGKEAKLWSDKLSGTWRPPMKVQFAKIIVPTVDTLRNSFMLEYAIKHRLHMLVVGNTGTGKTVLVQQALESLNTESECKLVINFSAATSSLTTQEVIEGAMEKKSKDKMGPPGGRRMITFVDDLNMPKKDTFGSQPPVELLRQWVDYGGWYDRTKQLWRFILDMQLMCVMAPPGGGRSEISQRFATRFHTVNFTFPDDNQVRSIFVSLLSPKLLEFDDEVKPLAGPLVAATVALYASVVDVFLPTPRNPHYLFNMRDIAKVIQGLMQADRKTCDSKLRAVKLWAHEACRIFSDRFTTTEDVSRFREVVDEKMAALLDTNWRTVMEDVENKDSGPVFCSFYTDPVGDAEPRYEEAVDLDSLKSKLDLTLQDYNLEPGFLPMELVVFRDALRHIARIHRILAQPRGNALLVGVGGSGRQSLTRLAAYLSAMKLFQIEITKLYRSFEFHEDLKTLYRKTGIDGQNTVFLFSDTQLKEESFLEDINNILSSGEVPNLFVKDEKFEVIDAMRVIAKAQGLPDGADDLWSLFIDRVRNHLHVVLAMSPIGDGFRNRCRMYPSLVNNTTIDWFHEWPADALQEVATRFLEDIKFSGRSGEEDADSNAVKKKVAGVFSFVHQSVSTASGRMLLELKRHNYVTPTNYLELVRGYRELLAEKRKELGDARYKLQNGLAKLDESRLQVEVMSVELAKKKEVVAAKAKDCDDLLVVIVSERRIADDQKAKVEADSVRIAREEITCKEIADDAEADLAKALPALNAALEEVDKLDKSSISEVKAYTKPPALVELVLSAVMTLFKEKTDWATAKKKISESNFLFQIKTFDKDNVAPAVMQKVQKYTVKPDFRPEIVRASSAAAAALCTWVLAIEIYATVAKEVAPKRAKLKAAMTELSEKQAALRMAQAQLEEVIAKVEALKKKHEDSVAEKNALREEAELLELKLDRANKLVSGLSGEKTRWESSISAFEAALVNLPGDVLVAAAFLSYAGPFDSFYRDALVKNWLANVKELGVPFTEGFSFATFLAKPTDVRDWNIQGLPADNFSTENGVIVTRGRRWPLMVDPQGQANKWVKEMEGKRLKVTDLKAKDYLRELENAIVYGLPYLLQDVEEELDPALEPVLNKSIIKRGNREVIKLGDKELDYSRDFKLYITTKRPNPHYTPEVSTKAAIVNFAVKEQGLEAQLLGIVVKMEEPKLEERKSDLVVAVAAGKRKLVDLENEILRLLATVKGSLLDDEHLVNTLQASKITSEEVTESLRVAEITELKIDAAREGYRPVATRASLLYFVLNDLASVDPMYQFSLDTYTALFRMSIKESAEAANANAAVTAIAARLQAATGSVGDVLKQRIDTINNYHTYATYKYACRGLFERHKLLLSLQICVKRQLAEGKIPKEEWEFFLKGGILMDRSDQRANPASEWLSAEAWDNVTELDKLHSFAGIASAFEQAPREWRQWYMSAKPEDQSLPGEWDAKCSELQHMIVVRCLRPDRVLFAATKYVSNNMGPQFVDPPPFDLKAVFDSSTALTPLVFVLSPGVDPTKEVQALADQLGVRLESCALGQGQAPIATRMLEEGMEDGTWVFLQNCHLSISWMPSLDKMIETYCMAGNEPHPNFRLWLSSDPHPKFPISILQRGVKMTTEPPRGLKANMMRLYNLMTDEQFNRCKQASKYKKLLFCLCWFHSVLLERRKFKSLGWNIPYDFNNADFSICEDILALYLDEYPDKTPWDAIRYLIAEANYGGRITDDWDRRLCNVYVSQYFCEEILNVPNAPLSELHEYYVPDDGDLRSYKDFIKSLPLSDHPLAFGQHPNADIQSAIQDTQDLLTTVISLQPRVVTAGGQSNESKVLAIAAELERTLPESFDAEEVVTIMATRSDPDPLKTVLFQEVDRYNKLLSRMKRSLVDLQKGVKGLVVITSELERVFSALLIGQVPEAWGFCYPSQKPLGSWMRDLIERCDQMRTWIALEMPKVFWLSGFTYPTGFLTALLQTSARRNGVAIDSLSWEFPVLGQSVDAIEGPPKEGAYVRGMFLEGARWDFEHNCLTEPQPMELFCPMPIVHFKPAESKKKSSKGMYVCPLYMYPVRTGTRERPSFMIPVDLKSGAVDGDFWVKRGTALLLSLSS